MLIIGLQFIAGRFHANPWGRNVNEGVPESPPSPYRLLRAVYDTWKRKRADWPERRLEPILRKLASRPPVFQLPPARAAHTRSFLNQNERDPAKKSLIFDAFVVLDPEVRILAGWPDVMLEGHEQSDLAELLGLINYIGRSESWVKAAIVPGLGRDDWNSRPSVENAVDSANIESVPVACPSPPAEYESRPLLRKARGKKASATPISWLEALAWSTGELIGSRRTEPPAFRYVSYSRPTNCFNPLPRSTFAPRRRAVNGVLYALECKVPPLVTSTLDIAEQVRRRLMGIHRRLMNGDPAKVSHKFSGKDTDGKPLRGHRHSFFLPQDRDGDGWLDHVLLICVEGLDEGERRALDLLSSLYQRGGRPEIRCVPVLWGSIDELLKPAKHLFSATPFVPPRHYRKGRGEFTEWLVAELRREATSRGLPAIVRVSPLSRLGSDGHSFGWIEFRRNRKDDAAKPGYGFEIEFAEPTAPRCGPLALGYGAHFGLGQFRSIRD
jgi:CRISPR-associated protein Csb2